MCRTICEALELYASTELQTALCTAWSISHLWLVGVLVHKEQKNTICFAYCSVKGTKEQSKLFLKVNIL